MKPRRFVHITIRTTVAMMTTACPPSVRMRFELRVTSGVPPPTPYARAAFPMAEEPHRLQSAPAPAPSKPPAARMRSMPYSQTTANGSSFKRFLGLAACLALGHQRVISQPSRERSTVTPPRETAPYVEKFTRVLRGGPRRAAR
ncbi:hypothetical protein [Streptomyces sp. MT206]|uniref:hypothetical protein n=1 Tax=Streptomyces sp. MT206 TaxID=3031407 RepID=UPI002FC8B93E